jgi:hypothetical protein
MIAVTTTAGTILTWSLIVVMGLLVITYCHRIRSKRRNRE